MRLNYGIRGNVNLSHDLYAYHLKACFVSMRTAYSMYTL